MARISELPKNERLFYSLAKNHALYVLEGYDLAIEDGISNEVPDFGSVCCEVKLELQDTIEAHAIQHLHFLGTMRMDSLLMSAVKNAFKQYPHFVVVL